MTRPLTLAEVARRRAKAPATPLWKPLGEFLDAFYAEEADCAAMLAEEPVAPVPREDAAYLAATAEHLSALYALAPPPWTRAERYFLEVASWPDARGRVSETIHFAESPVAFRRRFIFTEGRPLRRKDGPRPVGG